MKKVIIINFFTGLVIFLVGIFGLYLYKLHDLAVKGNNIFSLRCTKVNPLLITYKNSFLKYADSVNNPKKYSIDEVTNFSYGYILGMRDYVKEENVWLSTEKAYMNRWDYNLIQPWFMKQAGEYQWKMYEGYKDDAQYMLNMVDNPPNQIPPTPSEPRQRRDKYVDLYIEFSAKVSKISDWRKVFMRMPIPKGCTKENVTIPDTTGAIDWGEKSATPSPSITPINSDLI